MDEQTREGKHFAERDQAFLELLERRRESLEQAMWQAPALTIAAQAFLLVVLTDESVPRGVRWVVLAAGVAACFAAGMSLLRLRAREVRYSDAIAYYCEHRFDIPDPRPDRLPPESTPSEGLWQSADRGLRVLFGSKRLPPVYWLWLVALLAFVGADVVALLCT